MGDTKDITHRTYIVLQVRYGSTRLPGKLLLPLAGKSMFERILERLLYARTPSGVVVATTQETLPYIEKITSDYGVPCITGSEEDVLSRYVKAIEVFGIQTVIRATGDNPLVCIEYIDKAVQLHHLKGADLTTFPELPYGTGIEVIQAEALVKSEVDSHDPYEREHITQYIYRHSDRFSIIRGIPEQRYRYPDVRLTVDTVEDYEQMKKIYELFYRGRPIWLKDVLDWFSLRERA